MAITSSRVGYFGDDRSPPWPQKVHYLAGFSCVCLVAVFRVAEFCLRVDFLSQLSLVTGDMIRVITLVAIITLVTIVTIINIITIVTVTITSRRRQIRKGG